MLIEYFDGLKYSPNFQQYRTYQNIHFNYPIDEIIKMNSRLNPVI